MILVIAAVVLLIALLFIVMFLISQGALAESLAALNRGENRRFSSAFGAGVSNFWRVLGYFLLLVLISLGLLLAFGIPLALLVTVVFAGTEATGARILTVVLAALVGFVLLLVMFVPLIVVWQLGLREVVLRREGVIGSIGSGYRLFRRNLGKSLLLLVIQIAILIGAGIALLIATLLLGLLLAAPGPDPLRGRPRRCGNRRGHSGRSYPAAAPPGGLRRSGRLQPLLLDAGLPASHQRLWRPSSAMRRRNVETKTGY